MVTNEKYRTVFADVPFSAVHFQTYPLPSFVEQKGYCDKLLIMKDRNGNIYSEDDLPYYVDMTNHKSVICVLMSNDYGVLGNPPQVHILYDNTRYVYNMIYVVNEPSAQSTYFQLPIPHNINTQVALASEGCVTFQLFSAMTSEFLAETVVEFITPDKLTDCLYFNFYNEQNIPDFPFSSLTLGAYKKAFTKIIEGGIAPGAITFESEGETFRDQRFLPHLLASRTYKSITLSIGDNRGVPDYTADCVNSILDCSKIYVNGRKILRSADNVPTVTVIDKNYPLVTMSLEVENVRQNPNDYKVTL